MGAFFHAEAFRESSVAHFIGPPPELAGSLSGQSVLTKTCRSSFKHFPSQSQFNEKIIKLLVEM